MLYYMHELQRLWMAPSRMMAQGARIAMRNPWNPVAYTSAGRAMMSGADLFEHLTKRFGKPDWELDQTIIDGAPVDIEIDVVMHRTWCHLLRFKRLTDRPRNDPKVLIVAPLSGHYATLLRGTVEELLPDHDVYITDWMDARMIPVSEDKFSLNDYIEYLIDFLHVLGPDTHVVAVCQPAVPALAATAVMSGWGDTCAPATLTMMGGPIDTRENPTQVNKLATEKPIEWFKQHAIVEVPPPYPGAMRKVYPGFMQLTNFIAMNYDKHLASYHELFDHLVRGDDDAAEKKLAFYEEYRAVMDLPAGYFLQTVETVFQKHSLPKGEMSARWNPVKLEKIERTALLCIEGEWDDISGVGQTKAALNLTPNLPDEMKHYHLQKGAGHYGIFNGSKWRNDIAPVLRRWIRRHGAKSAKDLAA
ncbi:MAG: polyhydroxyalkanoate depolymerase [Alphaproteobacteria bacterium]|nr:polyhydroxyalkanoate depolymerase [Alphaproteobacteria bacterium]